MKSVILKTVATTTESLPLGRIGIPDKWLSAKPRGVPGTGIDAISPRGGDDKGGDRQDEISPSINRS
jgi:hypothetical protein